MGDLRAPRLALTSKDVDKVIRAEVWPFVREQGFVVRGRTARRTWDDVIDVINFQSYNRHVGDVHGMTTFSFQVNLGVQPTFLPGAGEPKEYECYFRGGVAPTVPKPPRRRRWLPFGLSPLPAPTDTFEIARDGSNLHECVVDARRGIEEQALPWFAARRTVQKLLAQLDYEHDSPMRDYVRGFALAHIGEPDAARAHLQRALDSEAFNGYGADESIRAALADL